MESVWKWLLFCNCDLFPCPCLDWHHPWDTNADFWNQSPQTADANSTARNHAAVRQLKQSMSVPELSCQLTSCKTIKAAPSGFLSGCLLFLIEGCLGSSVMIPRVFIILMTTCQSAFSVPVVFSSRLTRDVVFANVSQPSCGSLISAGFKYLRRFCGQNDNWIWLVLAFTCPGDTVVSSGWARWQRWIWRWRFAN